MPGPIRASRALSGPGGMTSVSRSFEPPAQLTSRLRFGNTAHVRRLAKGEHSGIEYPGAKKTATLAGVH